MRRNTMILLGWYLVRLLHPCLSIQHNVEVGQQCSIVKDNPLSMAKPSYHGEPVLSNGCVGDPDSVIHVIAMTHQPADDVYGSLEDPRNVTVRVTSLDHDVNRPIILVLATVKPVQWIVDVDEGITLEKILWSSMLFYPGTSFKINPSSQQKPPLYLEILPDSVADIGDGSPFNPELGERDHTIEFLDYIRDTYGRDVASFTGTDMKVDTWSLNINGGLKMEMEKNDNNKILGDKSEDNDHGMSSVHLRKDQMPIIFIVNETNVDYSSITLIIVVVILLLILLKRSIPRRVHIHHSSRSS